MRTLGAGAPRCRSRGPGPSLRPSGPARSNAQARRPGPARGPQLADDGAAQVEAEVGGRGRAEARARPRLRPPGPGGGGRAAGRGHSPHHAVGALADVREVRVARPHVEHLPADHLGARARRRRRHVGYSVRIRALGTPTRGEANAPPGRGHSSTATPCLRPIQGSQGCWDLGVSRLSTAWSPNTPAGPTAPS